MSYNKILIAVDSSEYSIRAAQRGFELASQLNAETALVFVVDTSKAMGNVDAGILPDQALIVLKKEAENTLEQIAKMFGSSGVIKFMPEGHPREDVVKTAENWEADLLVVGTHGRTGLTHLLLGSTAEHLIRHSKIPVMVVPANSKV